MIKKSRKELLKRLDDLQDMMSKKSDAVICASLEDWMNSDDQGTFNDYINKKVKGHEDATVLVDDMLLSSDIYLPTQLLFDANKETVKKFVQAVQENDEIRQMEMFIHIFEELFELEEVHDKEFYMTTPTLNYLHHSTFENGRWLSDEEVREKYYQNRIAESKRQYDILADVFSENKYWFYKDFLEHYRILSVDALVERYKDQRFFKMTT